MTPTTESAMQRITPAGQGRDEARPLPDAATRDGWLSEARQVWAYNRSRRAADAGVKAWNAAKVISLIALVDDQQEEMYALRVARSDLANREVALEAAHAAAVAELEAKLERMTEANGRNLARADDAERRLEWVKEALEREVD